MNRWEEASNTQQRLPLVLPLVLGDSKAYSTVLIAANESAASLTRAAWMWSKPWWQDLRQTSVEMYISMGKDTS